MAFYDRLIDETATERAEFLAIPLIRSALAGTVPRKAYGMFLGQAYHHVKETCPLLALAATRCAEGDSGYRDALFTYIAEEAGHDRWILDDLRDIGCDADAVRNATPDPPCRLMVAYVYYAICTVSPYALLGMVHVLEGMSAALAGPAAAAMQRGFGVPDGKGFRYLKSHGVLDADHVAFFTELVNGIADPAAQHAIVDTARMVYPLYGGIFRAIGRATGTVDAAHAA